MGYFDKIVRGQITTQQKFLKKKLYTLQMMESTMVIDHINNLNILFSQLKAMAHNIEKGKCTKILL